MRHWKLLLLEKMKLFHLCYSIIGLLMAEIFGFMIQSEIERTAFFLYACVGSTQLFPCLFAVNDFPTQFPWFLSLGFLTRAFNFSELPLVLYKWKGKI